MGKKKNYYLTLQSDLVEMEELSPRAKLLYGYIVSLSQQNGYCFATNRYFSMKLGICRRTVIRDLKALIKRNLITTEVVTEENGNRMRYIFPSNCHGGTHTTPHPVCQQRHTPRDSAVTHNKKRNMKNDISYESKFGIDWD